MSKRVLLAAAGVLLVVAVVGVIVVFLTIASQRQQIVTQLTYNFKGAFSHQAFGHLPEETPQPDDIYFTTLIDSIEASYTFEFLLEASSSEVLATVDSPAVSSEVEVLAVVESPGVWSKEVTLLPTTRKRGDFTVTFPLDTTGLLRLAGDIAASLGAGAPSSQITLKALVHTVAETDEGPIKADFVQSAVVNVDSAIVSWSRPLSQSSGEFYEDQAYRQRGEFGYVIYMKPGILYGPALSEKEIASFSQSSPAPVEQPTMPNPVYFSRVTDAVDATYTYRFLAEHPVDQIDVVVEVSAVVGSSGVWEKEVVLLPATRRQGDFTVAFPLDTAELLQLAGDIALELGTGEPAHIVTLKAKVQTVAQTPAGPIEEEFIQRATIIEGDTLVEWQRPLSQREKGESLSTKYEQQGVFSYRARLGENRLLGVTVLTPEPEPQPSASWEGATTSENVLVSEPEPRPTPMALEAAPSYLPDTLDRIDVTFDFEMSNNKPVTEIVHQVQITGLLDLPDDASESIVLVPWTVNEGDFTATSSLDVGRLYAAIEAAEAKGLTLAESSHDYTIIAQVTTKGQSDYGPVEDVLTQEMIVKLEPESLLWPEVTLATESGSIEESVLVPNPRAKRARIGSLAFLGVAVMLLAFVVWAYWKGRRWPVNPSPASPNEAQDRRARRKHRDILVDVESPLVLNGIEAMPEVLVRLGSLEELVKVAEALLKPVLHETIADEHIFYILDGSTRYQYGGKILDVIQRDES